MTQSQQQYLLLDIDCHPARGAIQLLSSKSAVAVKVASLQSCNDSHFWKSPAIS
jgi:hypothetical protein